MNHHWAMVFAVATLVPQIKTLRKIVIDLNGSKLPFSTNNVFDNEIDLWSVEGCFAFFLGPINTELSRCGTTGFFGSIPSLGFTNVLVAVRVTQSDTYTVIVHPEDVKDGLNEFDASHDLVSDLVFSNEEMCIVLCKSTNTRHS